MNTVAGVSWANSMQLISQDTIHEVHYILGNSIYQYAASTGYATNASTALTYGATVNGNSFPTTSTTATCAVKAIALRVSTLANYSNAQGLVAFGTMKPGQESGGGSVMANFTWDAIVNLPDVVVLPMSSLVGKSYTVYGRKYSTAADNFIAPTATPDDFSLPFVAVWNLYSVGAAVTVPNLLVDVMSTYDTIPSVLYANPLTATPDVSNPQEVSALNAANTSLAQSQKSVWSTVAEVAGGYAPMIAAAALGTAALGVGNAGYNAGAGILAGVRMIRQQQIRGRP